MYKHLDDPNPPVFGDDFRQAVGRRARRVRARRRRVAGGLGAALVVGGGSFSVAFISSGGPQRRVFDIEMSTASSAESNPPDAPDLPAGMSAAVDSTVSVGDSGPLNVLFVGSDSRACIDQDSPYAAAFGDVEGERADTIMILRLEPERARIRVLLLPRDLWIDLADGGATLPSETFGSNPQRLIDAIQREFDVGIDHFVQVDFCGFSGLVDVIGGVPVPFDVPVRDVNAGLLVPSAECRILLGEEALAYVRSRWLETYDALTGAWVGDEAGEVGRIARQRDFVVRMFTQLFDPERRAGDPLAVADAVISFVATDSNLTLDVVGQTADAFGDLSRVQIEAVILPSAPRDIAGDVVRVADLDPDVLDMFRDNSASDVDLSSVAAAAEQNDPSPIGDATQVAPESMAVVAGWLPRQSTGC